MKDFVRIFPIVPSFSPHFFHIFHGSKSAFRLPSRHPSLCQGLTVSYLDRKEEAYELVRKVDGMGMGHGFPRPGELSQFAMERSTMLLMGKSTISTGPFSIAMLVHQRVAHFMIHGILGRIFHGSQWMGLRNFCNFHHGKPP